MSGNRGVQGKPLPFHPSDETIQRMLSVQEQRLAVELKSTEVTLKQLEHNQKIADKSIEAQVSDRKDERAHEQKIHSHRLIFAAVILGALLVFVVVALLMNKEAIVLDLVKLLVGFIGGWGASLTWTNTRRRGNGANGNGDSIHGD